MEGVTALLERKLLQQQDLTLEWRLHRRLQ
jgi:hypothetical protein